MIILKTIHTFELEVFLDQSQEIYRILQLSPSPLHGDDLHAALVSSFVSSAVSLVRSTIVINMIQSKNLTITSSLHIVKKTGQQTEDQRVLGLIPAVGHVLKCHVDFSLHIALFNGNGYLMEWSILTGTYYWKTIEFPSEMILILKSNIRLQW